MHVAECCKSYTQDVVSVRIVTVPCSLHCMTCRTQEREAIVNPAPAPSLRTTDDLFRGGDEPRSYRRSTQLSALPGGRKRTSATGSIGRVP